MIRDISIVPMVMMSMIMTMNTDVKVCQNKEPGEPHIRPPKRIRDPCIQSMHHQGRSIIGDYRGALTGIIIIYC